MNLKTKRKLAGTLAVGLILVLLIFLEYISGDPISNAWACRRAVAYAEKLYPGQTFTATCPGGGAFRYLATVQSDQKRDNHFYVETKFWLFTTDDMGAYVAHTDMVDSGYNTAVRLQEEGAQATREILRRELPQYAWDDGNAAIDVQLHFGTLQGEGASAAWSDDWPETWGNLLQDETDFTPDLLQAIPTRLYVCLATGESPTPAALQQAQQSIKAAMEANGYPFAAYNVMLYQQQAQENYLESGDVLAQEIP